MPAPATRRRPTARRGSCSPLLDAVLRCPARADIRIDLTGVDGDLRRNVLALLSLERYKDHDRLEPAAVQRLYNRIDDEVRTALRPYGYYDPKISSSIEPPDKEHALARGHQHRYRAAGADR